MNRLLWFALGGITVLAATRVIITAICKNSMLEAHENLMKNIVGLSDFESDTGESTEGESDA